MSAIIELQEEPPKDMPPGVKNILKSIFKSQDIPCRNIVDEGKSIIFFVKSSPTTYRLTTIWKFNLGLEKFSLQIQFYNKAQDDLLRGYTDRMKIEVSILTRMINDQVMPNFCFFVDNQSGVLRLAYTVAWSTFYQISVKKENVFMLVMNLFQQLRKYDELMRFLQPMFNFKQVDKEKDPRVRINKFRAVLKNTKFLRHKFQSCMGDLLRARQMNQQAHRAQIQQIKYLYMTHIGAFQQSTVGLEDAEQFNMDEKLYEHELKQITKNQRGITNFNKNKHSNSRFDADRIVYGLLSIQSEKQSKQTTLSTEGAHSQIYRKNFKYVIVQTLNTGTVNEDVQEWRQRQKKVSGELTYKTCNTDAETSVNSFKNQINAITYMKDMSSPFIARYYLKIKETWDQSDIIYMNNYKKNVFHLLKDHSSFSSRMRLELAYRIAKGLCFLYSKQILHRDFKPQNVVVDSNLIPKILDFGSSVSHFMKNSYKSHDERLLSTDYFHIQYHKIPAGFEYLRQKFTKRQYDQHPLFDVYGFGRTLCFIFFGTLTLPHPETLINEPMAQLLSNVHFLIQMCLNVDPDDRPGFGELTSFLGILKELIKNILPEEDEPTSQGKEQASKN